MNTMDLAMYQTLIKQRCGLLFEGADANKLTHAVHQRCAALGLTDITYYARIQVDADEFQQLVNLLTINETYFFREPQQIEWLVQHLAPRLLAAHDGKTPVRILSAGCSSGEEPYSIAIALLEKYGASTARLFTLLAGDIDSNMLVKARAGHYSGFSFRGVPDEIRRRHFSAQTHGYQLHDELRKLVQFEPLNLLADDFAPSLQQCDVILLRNVSIYFDTTTRAEIQRRLASLLTDDGVLVIGMAETLANDLGVLPLIEEHGLYYFGKNGAATGQASTHLSASTRINVSPTPAPSAPPIPPAPLVTPADWRPRPEPIPEHSPDPLATLRQAVADKHYDSALAQLEPLLTQAPQHSEALILKAHILLERKDFSTAATLAQQVIDQDEWSVDAWLLLGLAAKWQGDTAQALRSLKQAVYAHHACWPAQYFLADLCRTSGAVEAARRAYRVVLQLLADANAATGLRYLPLELPASEIRFLCQHQLAQLGAN